MNQLFTYNVDGTDYDITADQEKEFLSDMPTAKRVYKYRTNDGNVRSVTDDNARRFAELNPDAVPVRSIRKADGSVFDLNLDRKGIREFDRNFETDPSFEADREERDAILKQRVGEDPNSVSDAIERTIAEGLRGGGRALKEEGRAFVGIGTGLVRLAGTAAKAVGALGSDTASNAGSWLYDLANSVDSAYDDIGKDELASAYSSKNEESGKYEGEDWGANLADKAGSAAGGIMSFIAAGAAGKLGNATMVANAANDSAVAAYDEAKKRQASDTEALGWASVAGIINGAGTYAMMKLPVSKWLKDHRIKMDDSAASKTLYSKLIENSFKDVNASTFTGQVAGQTAGAAKVALMKGLVSAGESSGIMGVQSFLGSLASQGASKGAENIDYGEAAKAGGESFAEGLVIGGVMEGMHAYGYSAKRAEKYIRDMEKKNGKSSAFAVATDYGSLGVRPETIALQHKMAVMYAEATPEGRRLLVKHTRGGMKDFLRSCKDGKDITPEIADKAGLPIDLSQSQYNDIFQDYMGDYNRKMSGREWRKMQEAEAAEAVSNRETVEKNIAETDNAVHDQRQSELDEVFGANYLDDAATTNEGIDRYLWADCLEKHGGDKLLADREFKQAMAARRDAELQEEFAASRVDGMRRQHDADLLVQSFPEEYQKFLERTHLKDDDDAHRFFHSEYMAKNNPNESTQGFAKPLNRPGVSPDPSKMAGVEYASEKTVAKADSAKPYVAEAPKVEEPKAPETVKETVKADEQKKSPKKTKEQLDDVYEDVKGMESDESVNMTGVADSLTDSQKAELHGLKAEADRLGDESVDFDLSHSKYKENSSEIEWDSDGSKETARRLKKSADDALAAYLKRINEIAVENGFEFSGYEWKRKANANASSPSSKQNKALRSPKEKRAIEQFKKDGDVEALRKVLGEKEKDWFAFYDNFVRGETNPDIIADGKRKLADYLENGVKEAPPSPLESIERSKLDTPPARVKTDAETIPSDDAGYNNWLKTEYSIPLRDTEGNRITYMSLVKNGKIDPATGLRIKGGAKPAEAVRANDESPVAMEAKKPAKKVEKKPVEKTVKPENKETSDDPLEAARAYAKEELSRIDEYAGGGDLPDFMPNVDELDVGPATRLADAFNRAREAAEIAAELDAKSIDDPSDNALRKRFYEADEKAAELLDAAQQLAQDIREIQDGKVETLASRIEKTNEKPGKFKVGDRVADMDANGTVTVKGVRPGKNGAEYDLGNGRWIPEAELDARNEEYKELRNAIGEDNAPMTLKEAFSIIKGGSGKSLPELKKMREMWAKSSDQKAGERVRALDAIIAAKEGTANKVPDWVHKLSKEKRAEYDALVKAGDQEALADFRVANDKTVRKGYDADERQSRKESEIAKDIDIVGSRDVSEIAKKRDIMMMYAGDPRWQPKIDAANRLIKDYIDRRWERAVGYSRGDKKLVKEAVDVIKRLAPDFNVKVVDDTNKKSYADFDLNSNTITIYGDAGVRDVMHDVGWHVMRRWAELNSPDMLAKLNEYAESAPQSVKDYVSGLYADFKGDRNAFLDELGAIRWERAFSGDLASAMRDARNRSWFKKMGDAVKNLYVDAARKMGIDVGNIDIDNALKTMNASEFVDFMASEIVNGKRLSNGVKELVKPDAKTTAEAPSADGEPVVDVDGKRYSYKSMRHDLDEGHMVDELIRTKVFADAKEAKKWVSKVNKLMDALEPRLDILDMNETIGREDRLFSPYKPNSDKLYTISLDFSTLCKKRIFTQKVIDRLQSEVKKDFLTREEQIAVRDMLKDYQKIDKDLQVACHLCYVEAARLKAPDQQKKLFQSPEYMRGEFVNYLAKKDPAFRKITDAAKKDWLEEHGYDRKAVKDDLTTEDRAAFEEFSKEFRKKNYKPTKDELATIRRFVKMGKEPFLDSQKLMRLAIDDPQIFNMYNAFIREATHSKGLEPDVPYYFGDSRLRTKDGKLVYDGEEGSKAIMTDGFIKKMNAQGTGLRHQSWSDFQITHLLDTVTALADLSTRGAKMHCYTKVPEFVEIFGKSGIMYNLSLIPEMKDGKWGFSPVEGMDYKTAMALRRKFHDTVGTIAIAADFGHLRQLLKNASIDYVIPYHSSGMPIDVRNMAGIGRWHDFEDIQHTTVDKSRKAPAKKPAGWHKEPSLYEWVVDEGKGGLRTMQDSAMRYVELCNERGMRPKFAEVDGLMRKNADGTYTLLDKNYWKLLVDHKMVDGKDRIIQQKAVRPEFDLAAAKKAIAKEIGSYDEGRFDRAFDYVKKEYDTIDERISRLKDTGEMEKTIEGIKKAKRHSLKDDGPDDPNDDGPGGGLPVKGEKSTRNSIKGIYTGTSADYDKPSLLKIGTGEGSQVYGWGLYGSNQRGVANVYADLMKRRGDYESSNRLDSKYIKLKVNGTECSADSFIAEAGDYGFSLEASVLVGCGVNFKFAEEYLRRKGQYTDKSKEFFENLKGKVSLIDGTPGIIYEQTWFTNREPGDESHLLKWYEPVSEDNIKRIIDQYAKEHDGADIRAESPSGTMTEEDFGSRSDFVAALKEQEASLKENGGLLYNFLSKILKSPKAASEFLASADIDGIKYPVDSYGGKTIKDGDKAGWNYVSFRDDNISVDHKWVNGEQRYSRKDTESEGGVALDWTKDKETRIEAVRRTMQDHNLPIKRAEEILGISREDSFYDAKDKVFGKNDHELRVLEKKTVEPILKGISDSGAKIGRVWDSSNQSSEVGLDDYLYAMHAKERNKVLNDRDGTTANGSGMSDATADAILASFANMDATKRKAIEDAADLVWKMNDAGLTRRVESGRMSVAEADALRRQFKHYVPLRTNMEADGNDLFNNGTAGLGKHEFHKALGRSSEADSPLVFSMMQARDSIMGSNKNEARRKLLDIVTSNNGVADVWRYEDASKMWYKLEKDASGKEVVTDKKSARFFTPNESDMNDVVLAKKDGNLYAMQFYNEQGRLIARSATDKGVVRFNEHFEFIPQLTRLMAAMRTQLVPTFTIRNLITDHTEAFLNVIGDRGVKGAAKFFGRMEKEFWNRNAYRAKKMYFRDGEFDLSTEEGRDFKTYVENGGLIGGGRRMGYGEQWNEFDKALAEARRGKFSPKGIVSKLGELMTVLNEQVEVGTRFAVFRECLRGDKKMSVKDAIAYSRDLTTNFNRKGEITPVTNSLFMFSNAAIQGLSRAVKAMNVKGDNKSGAYQALAFMTLLGTTQALWSHFMNDDEDRKRAGKSVGSNTSEHTKQNAVEYGLGGKTLHVKARYPWAVPMYVARKATELFLGDANPKDAVGDLGEGVVAAMLQEPFGHGGTFAQTVSPSLLVPVTQVLEGKDFRGEDLYRKNYVEEKPDSENGRKSTGGLYQAVAKGLNYASGGNAGRKGYVDVAPETVKLILETIGGGIQTDIGRVANLLGRVKDTIVDGDVQVSFRDVPFLGDVMRENSPVDGKYYETLNKVEADKFEYKSIADKRKANLFAKSHRQVTNEKLKSLANEIKDLSHREDGEVKKGSKYVPAELSYQIRKLAGEMKRRKMAEYVRLYEQMAR